MTSQIFFIFFIPFVALLLLIINFLFATHNPNKEKISPFECGFHSFLGQNRSEFNVSFFIFALLFLIFDLEILLMFPYVISKYNNSIFGLVILLLFILVLTLGFVYEIGKKALSFTRKDDSNDFNNNNN